MTDEASTEIPADAEAVAVGAGIASDPPLGEPEAPKSAREIMDAELSKIEAAKGEEPKPKAEAKAAPVKAKEEPAPVEKPVVAKSDGVKPAAVPGEQVAKPSEGKAPEPPARFMPAEKELWRHVPNQLKSAVARIEREYAAEAEQYQASRQFHEELREYDELAKTHNTTVKEALASYVGFEQSFAKDPEGTLPRLLQRVNMNPMQAVLAILKSAGATPQQFAEHVRLNPGQYQGQQAMQPMRQPAQPAPDPMASRAMQEVQELKHHLVRQEVLTNVVDPFRAEHPRFDELQEDIAFFLNSGKIPDSMDDFERLAAAYDMADRINPASYRDEPQAEPAQPTALVNPVAGKKSIRGAPTGGKAPAMRTPSIRDALANNWPV